MYNSRLIHLNSTSPVKLDISLAQNNSDKYTPKTIKRNPSQSNYKQSGEKPAQADLLKSLCNQLENQLCQANSDLELANFRARKAVELEQKIENVLKQNAALCSENEILQKQSNQRKAESDIWRQKYESQMNNIVFMKSNYEMETKRLTQVNQRAKDELKQGEINLVRSIEETKQRLENEHHEKIENMKKSHKNNIDLYEEQLKKIRQILEEREKEFALLQSQVFQVKYDGNNQNNRVVEDREKLKMKISELELQSQQELENLRSKLDNQTLQQLDSLKRLHDNELEVMSGEINKLRGLLDVKTREIEALIEQNRGQKVNFEEEVGLLRAEIQALKKKIVVNNNFANAQIQEVKEQLAKQNLQDIEGLKYHNENQLEALNNEIQSLQRIVADKQEEIENQIREKGLQRENYNQEICKLQEEIENWKYNLNSIENLKNQEIEQINNKYNCLNEKNIEFQRQQKDQIQYLEGEVDILKGLINSKNYEIVKNREQNGQIVEGFQQDINNLQEDNENTKKNLDKMQNEKYILIEDLKMKLQVYKNNSIEEKKKFQNATKYLEQDIQRFQEIISVKDQEIENLKIQRENQDREIKKLNNEYYSQADHILKLQKLKAKELEDLRLKLENQNNFTTEQIKASHQNQVNIMNGEIQDLKHILQLRNTENQELINKYERLEQALEQFQYNAEKVKEHDDQCKSIRNHILNNKIIYDSKSKSRISRYSQERIIK
ncbi:tetrin c, putative [Ichthyophthirius multifiliis]|uniref:Tetrin c, putative n=1 Tax=Ichthyophthirius multifiliis TaxID=5932 RepID=G0QVW7_ICHMU|nr:tetrin c, putative [Ichthyophthirius multifiliis]EGR30632.1 tetrin c, putative [Ichthyophthirius multifiliis]|eukprot:XP_004032219.1 tetrin c, putative [Ichthyophthirius multifiliis]